MSIEEALHKLHHVFLPPKLPQKNDANAAFDEALLKTVINCLSSFEQHVAGPGLSSVASVKTAMQVVCDIHELSGRAFVVSEKSLKYAFSKLCDKGGSIPLYIDAQNAGLIVSKLKQEIIFEVFELSPGNEDVMGNRGRLRRSFPASGVSVTLSLFANPDFQHSIASTVSKMSWQAVSGTQKEVKKAQQMHKESRDTTSPEIVTEFLMAFLVALGGSSTTTTAITKNTREEVVYEDAELPWRRSPFWLFIRVTLQIIFRRSSFDPHEQRDLYKEFIAFLMTNIAQQCHNWPVESDYLSVINAKLSRRLLKLAYIPEGLGQFIRNSMTNTNRILEMRWSNIQTRSSKPLSFIDLPTLDFENDSKIKLPLLDDFIAGLSIGQGASGPNLFAPTLPTASFQEEEIPTIPGTSNNDQKARNLMAFETWVSRSLGPWLESHQHESSTSGKLRFLIEEYHSQAAELYAENPELTSIMVLTTLELWVACDKSASELCPMLCEYDPGLSCETLQNLILPFKSQIERLEVVESYILRRQQRSVSKNPSIFHDFGSARSFGVRCYEQSPKHQQLLQEIETQAEIDRTKKYEEFERKKDLYDSLIHQHAISDCEVVIVFDYPNGTRETHHGSCRRCSLKSQANNLTIAIHEWPLPSNTLKAKGLVFELLLPESFSHWRDITIFVMLTTLKMEYTSEKNPNYRYPLRSYEALSSYGARLDAQRVGLLSETKPHAVTHRRERPISTTLREDVCVNNGLVYRYFDTRNDYFMCDIRPTQDLPQLCTYKLPSNSMQQFLFRPSDNPSGPSPNTILANLHNCPDDMSLEEYKALCAIPLGYMIQWHNILVQLNAPTVDFKRTEAETFLLQCIGQVGLRKDRSALRPSHQILEDPNFAKKLIEGIRRVSNQLKQNWQAASAFSAFISLTAHLLSLSPQGCVVRDCREYLAFARAVTLDWMMKLKNKAYTATRDDAREKFRAKSAAIALVCAGTFDVDHQVQAELLQSSEAASTFLQCCIVIQESELLIGNRDHSILLRYDRWRRLCQSVCPILKRHIIEQSSPALDDAIVVSWPAFEGSGNWKPFSEIHNTWLVKDVATGDKVRTSQVQFNLESGELLVDGNPLNRLPNRYAHHPMYRILFGQSTMEVMPSHLPGMEFTSKSKYAGHILHFGLTNPIDHEPELLVLALRDGHSFSLLPRHVFRGHFPVPLVEKCIHWYNVRSHYVEFRPQKDPWNHADGGWQLHASASESKWRLGSSDQYVIGIKSRTGESISRIFGAIETSSWIQAAVTPASGLLDIELPRLQISFRLRERESSILSKEFQDMVVDNTQAAGALVGLQNTLILRNQVSAKRLILVPEGKVSFRRLNGHIQVSIDAETVVKTHGYHIDDRIGRLMDNGSAQSKLLIAYLHALTSFCLPDPLTGRTGTEQALDILDSAAVKSFDRWSRESMEILMRIASLTPGRRYYPENETVMQTVKWSSELGFLAQHSGFFTLVQSIFERTERSKFFYQESWVKPPVLRHVDCRLLDRDDIRSSTFRLSGYGAELYSTQYDISYKSRDTWKETTRVQDVVGIAGTLYRESMEPHFALPTNLVAHLWQVLSRTAIQGWDHQLSDTQLAYDAKWFQEASFVLRNLVVLHRVLRDGLKPENKLDFTLWLSVMAFGAHVDLNMLYIIAGLAILPAMGRVDLPSGDFFRLEEGVCPTTSEVSWALRAACQPMQYCPEQNLEKPFGESKKQYNSRRNRLFQYKKSAAVNSLTKALMAQWPCSVLQVPVDPDVTEACHVYINMPQAMVSANQLFESWFNNRGFKEYLGHISDAVPRRERRSSIANLSLKVDGQTTKSPHRFISTEDVFSRCAPRILDATCSIADRLLTVGSSVKKADLRLPSLAADLERLSSSKFEREYVQGLKRSLEALKDSHRHSVRHEIMQGDVLSILRQHQEESSRRVNEIYRTILKAVYCNSLKDIGSIHAEEIAVPNIYQWPRICPSFFLQQLCKKRWHAISPDWQRCIIQYGIALTHFQQAERLLGLASNAPKLMQELTNVGHTNWDPHEDPESLIFEIEGNIMIRNVQTQIATEMRRPTIGKNAVMQLNMGEGKSSVIVPMVAASLADESLVRVIVAKPQEKQMFDMLVSKLGGLVDRPVFRAPFSRAVKPGQAEAEAVHRIYENCMKQGGILLVQPEHILSFKLMSIERACCDRDDISLPLLQTQEFLNKSCRDIVDESDENLSPKFELVYTVGTQRPLDHSPSRWSCPQEILGIFREYIPLIQKQYPNSMETFYIARGSFPRTRILRTDAMERMLTKIVEHIRDFGLIGFTMAEMPRALKNALCLYISKKDLTDHEIKEVEQQVVWTEAERNTLLLLRGLIAGGVLSFVFSQKRWKVDYGLALDREPATKLAVPYRAKDNPSPRSEFSHPEVVILLTLLSYYYRGLDTSELFLAFSHLQKSDQASSLYQEWVRDADQLPTAFHQLDGVNLEDYIQCSENVFPSLRHAKSVVDYYVGHIVFPKAMKEFAQKLSASGWDIAEVKQHVTTGFSGTNDSRIALPLSMEQLDLQEQRHTNALVLEYLLQPENDVEPMPTSRREGESDAERLLSMIIKMKQKVRVIIDVGAQILELNNREVAAKWLEQLPDDEKTQAVVFLDENDNLCALDRRGKVEFLHVSPFATRLDVCLIFLDEAHTRGTDLKLPQDYRAAVTLGANLTKDRLVQACMRMRQLGKGQSVVFCVPEEIVHRIRLSLSKPTLSRIHVSDVIAWSISETWIDAKRCMALWAMQGKRYDNQQKLWTSYRDGGRKIMPRQLAEKFLEGEAKTLKMRYKPLLQQDKPSRGVNDASEEPDEIDRRIRDFQLEDEEANFQQEAERELSPEVEEERQVEKPRPANALAHKLHADVLTFVERGELRVKSSAYMPAFESLSRTSAALRTRLDAPEYNSVYVTTDFANTVASEGQGSLMDSYQRPVQWILSRRKQQAMDDSPVAFLLIISPFEAQELISRGMSSKRVSLHIYAPRPNLGFRPLDSLDLLTMPQRTGSGPPTPQSLITWLNLFAGQLYFKSWSQYKDACQLLGVSWGAEDGDEACALPGSAASSVDRQKESADADFRDSIAVLMKRIRRSCQDMDLERTHVGAILAKRVLMRYDFTDTED
ncbi:hypothetical protein NOR_06970 [Metarhizium rileyi]|uniref:ubiquitinyl hydrolase 1 n=1 Tax=Metarhizium rileyi (strain RCEF 4871) TaxID=1649241 RepID=A0A166ZGD6_METRR|nr:hypothetical protein NOR_06970 [Metarhizium rileyi RCEF 4871]